LLGILERLVVEEGYLVQKYAQIIPAAGKMKRTFMRKACPDWEHPAFLSVAMQLAASLRHAVFVDQVGVALLLSTLIADHLQVVYSVEDREELRALLREHVMENVVRIGDTVHRQSVGIPQGSVLSTILCSFFYGDLESTKLGFTKDPNSLLLRFVDDFLFITADQWRAIQFLKEMDAGHPEYGCFISKEKTSINFELNDSVTGHVNRLSGTEFPWCGLTINPRTLGVRADYGRYNDAHMSDTLSVDSTKKAGTIFRQKLFQTVKQRSHIIFNDTNFNAPSTVYLNIYQNFLVSAMKTHTYLRAWHADLVQHSPRIAGIILEAINFGYFAIVNKVHGRLAKDNNAACSLRRSFVQWLGLHAFHHILSLRKGVYLAILPILSREMAGPKLAKGKRHLAHIVKQGLASLGYASF